MKKLNITFCSFPDFSGNARALYEYMVKRYDNSMNLVWCVADEGIYKKLRSRSIKSFLIGSSDFKQYVKNTDVFFTTHCNLTSDKPLGSLYVELWHGIGIKKSGFLVNNMSDKEWYYSLCEDVDYFIVPTDFWSIIFAALFKVEQSRVLPLGYPKFDYIRNKDAKKMLSKILEVDVNAYNKIIYYAPTFKKGCNRNEEAEVNISNILNLKQYREEELLSFLKKNNYLMCLKIHPSEELNINITENENVKIIRNNKLIENEIEIEHLLNAANLLITDYSSLGIEFAFLSKPVLYLDTDLQEYSKNRGIVFEEFSFWTSDITTNDINSCKSLIKELLENPSKNTDEIDLKKKLWFSDKKNGGCKDICDFIFDDVKKAVSENVQRHYSVLRHTKDENLQLIKQISSRDETIKEQSIYLSSILNSKSWRLIQRLRNMIKLFRK